MLLLLTLPLVTNPALRAFGWFEILNQGGYLGQTVTLLLGQAAGRALIYSRLSVVIVLVAGTVPIAVFTILFSIPNDRIWAVCDELGMGPLTRVARVTLPVAMHGVILSALCVFWLALGASVETSIVDGPTEINLSKIVSGLLSVGNVSAACALGSCILLGFAASCGLAAAGARLLEFLQRTVALRRALTSARTTATPPDLSNLVSPRFFPLEKEARSSVHTISTRRAQVERVVAGLAVLLCTLLAMAPVSSVLFMSTETVSTAHTRVLSFLNYQHAWADPMAREALMASLLVAVPVGIACGVIAFTCGLLWWHRRLRVVLLCGLAVLALIPADTYVLGLLGVLRAIGRQDASLIWVGIAHVAAALPFCIAITFAANSLIDVHVFDVASEIGASRVLVIWDIVLKLVWPSVVAACVTGMLVSFSDYTRAWYLSGNAQLLPLYLYGRLKAGTDPRVYAIGGVVILLVLVSLLIIGVFSRWGIRATPRNALDPKSVE
jgi:ABC-type spermidine/putrescine transport system permease subunit II